MLIDVEKLKREKAAAVAGMREIAAAVEKRDDKTLTPEERKASDDFMTTANNLAGEITRAEFLNKQETDELATGDDNSDEYREFSEFVMDLRNGDTSRMEARDVTMGKGANAGFMVPEQFDTTIRAVEPHDAVVRPRAMTIPAGTPPDSAITLVALDQGGDKGVYSGMTMKWVGETETRPSAGDPTLKQIKLEPQLLTGWVDVSDKMLNNSAAVGAWLMSLMRGAIIGAEEDTFGNGDGVGKPLGFRKSKAAIKVQRSTSSKIGYADLVAMFPLVLGKNLAWVGNRTILPQLMTMVATNTNTLVWQPSAIVGAPSTLLGLPLLEDPYAPILGQVGDLALVDLDYYAIKDGTPLSMFLDPYSQKANGLTRMYAYWNVDGQSMLNGSILQPDAVTRKSPFVLLK